jgi:hypothetical protein
MLSFPLHAVLMVWSRPSSASVQELGVRTKGVSPLVCPRATTTSPGAVGGQRGDHPAQVPDNERDLAPQDHPMACRGTMDTQWPGGWVRRSADPVAHSGVRTAGVRTDKEGGIRRCSGVPSPLHLSDAGAAREDAPEPPSSNFLARSWTTNYQVERTLAPGQ